MASCEPRTSEELKKEKKTGDIEMPENYSTSPKGSQRSGERGNGDFPSAHTRGTSHGKCGKKIEHV